LGAIVKAAMQYEAGLLLDDQDLQELFSCGSSPGGARPKTLIKKESGSLWIAKFPKSNDSFHVEPIEAATLKTAQDAGLPVPEFEIREAGELKILLVKRFDVSNHGGRYHMTSMQTLLNADEFYNLSYSNLLDVIQKHSALPLRDMDFMFCQMIFLTWP